MNDKNDHKREISSWEAALIGVAAGALAVTLANRETREKIRGKISEILGKGRERMKDLESQARQRAAEELEKARDKIKEEK